MDKGRNLIIDNLRVLGIFLIILAHSNPPNLIFQVRNFDVVMMVILMTLSYKISSDKRKEINYINYVNKRIQRLLIPTFLFLIFYFLMSFIMSCFVPEHYHFFNQKTIISSFLLLDGFGYIWIIRIYFILSLFLPLLKKISSRIESNYIYIFLVSFLIVIQEILVSFNYPNNIFFKFLNYYFIDVWGYILIAAISIRLFSLNKKKVSIISIVIFIIFSFYFDFTQLQIYKYPPRMYYLLYGFCMTIILYIVLEKFYKCKANKANSVILFISNYSLELYFWHIVYIYILKGINFMDDLNWFGYYVVILLVSILATYIQVAYFPKLFKSKELKK